MSVLICGWDEGLLRRLLAAEVAVTLVINAAESKLPTVRELAPQLQRLHRIDSYEQLSRLAGIAVTEQQCASRFEQVIGATEDSQLAAGYLATLLGVDQAALRRSVLLRDKRAMKEVLRAAGVPVARQLTLQLDDGPEACAERIESGLGWPAVIKPVAGAGTENTVRLADRAEAVAFLSRADGPVMMAEQFLDGIELHIDAVCVDGELRVLGVCRYIVPRIQLRHAGRANGSALLSQPEHAELYAECERLQRAVNAGLGLRTAITHMEAFLAPDGTLWFSEIAGRVGGGGVNAMFETAEVDLRLAFAQGLAGAGSGSGPCYPQRQVGWIHLAPESSGRVVELPSKDSLAGYPHVLRVQRCVSEGDRIGPMNLMSWICLVTFAADSWPEFLDRAAELEREARVVVEAA